jgi:hypothetical protein
MRGLAFTLTCARASSARFAAGEALADPGGLAGGLLTALWARPMVALSVLAEPSPDRPPGGAPHRVSESPTAADRPASSRATGTRNGEQDT